MADSAEPPQGDFEDALRKSERFREEAEALGRIGTWEQDLLTGHVSFSTGQQRLFFGDDRTRGAKLEDYVEAVHPDDRERILKLREQLLATDSPRDVEFRVRWPDGTVHVIFGRQDIVRDAAGRPVRAIGTNADVTEQRRVEHELREQRELLQTLSRRLLQAQEAERRRVARELHDDLGQLLTAIRVDLQRQGTGLGGTIALVDDAIERMRELARDLRPAVLDDLGLAPALRWYVTREAQRAGLEADLDLGQSDNRLPSEIETTCFRVVQEALTNAIRHARARRFSVTLRGSAREGVELTVHDDGKGFDVAEARKRAAHGKSQGLLGMQERVALASGELVIESGLDLGTTIRVRFLTPGFLTRREDR